MKSSPLIWRYVVCNCQIEGKEFVDFVAFLENTNFKWLPKLSLFASLAQAIHKKYF